jgi:hypothetical protein
MNFGYKKAADLTGATATGIVRAKSVPDHLSGPAGTYAVIDIRSLATDLSNRLLN